MNFDAEDVAEKCFYAIDRLIELSAESDRIGEQRLVNVTTAVAAHVKFIAALDEVVALRVAWRRAEEIEAAQTRLRRGDVAGRA